MNILISLLIFVLFNYPFGAQAKPSLNDELRLMWQVPVEISDNDLQLMKGKGINLVQLFGLLTRTNTEIKTYLDRMHNNNLGVIVSIVGTSRKDGVTGKWVFNGEHASILIKAWKNHPAVFAWHLFDEPSNKGNKEIPVSVQEQAYAMVKKIDPVHPVFLSWNGTSDWHYRYFSEKSFDILDLHAYVRTTVGGRQKNLLEAFKRHRKRTYPVLITISAHNKRNFPALPGNALRQQYDFFYRQNNLTRNIGFYGWKLSPNIGIHDDPGLMKQFTELSFPNESIMTSR